MTCSAPRESLRTPRTGCRASESSVQPVQLSQILRRPFRGGLNGSLHHIRPSLRGQARPRGFHSAPSLRIMSSPIFDVDDRSNDHMAFQSELPTAVLSHSPPQS